MKVKAVLAVFLTLIAVGYTQRFPGQFGGQFRPPAQQFHTYDLPDGVEFIVGPVQAGFTCDGRRYGYYADVGNLCRIFHVCNPVEDEFGRIVNTLQYSFFCGNQTAFNQATLTCDLEENVDCASSEFFYSVNDNFGVIPPNQFGKK